MASSANMSTNDKQPNQRQPSHVESAQHFDREWREEKWQDRHLSQAAADRSHLEHNLTPLQAIKAYPMAIFWCLAVSMTVIMEGYDTILISNFYAFPTFQRKYGEFVGISDQTRSGYQLSPQWMAGLGNAAGVGAFFGTLICGYLVAIFGQKRVLLGSLILLSCFIFVTFFAPNIGVLLAGQVLCGFPWGAIAVIAPAYASECLPMVLRVYLTSWTNMCFIIGQLIAAGVLRACLGREDEWGYRIPFAIQWIWPCLLIPLLSFSPESPWHLVRHHRLDDAEKSLRRLQRASANIDVKETLATIVFTNNLEEELSVGTSYWDCFTGFERRRTEIACLCFAGQVLSGSSFAYNASYFFEQVGLPTETTYSLNLGGTGLALVGTLVNWFALMPYFGRRAIYVTGMFTMGMILYLIGILNVWNSKDSVGMTQAILTLAWTFCFQLSAGQLGWAIPAEIGSTRLRQKTVCLARNSYYIISVIAGVLQPYFMNPQAWNLRGYTGFIWGSTAMLVFVWSYFRLPETKGRTYEQLDVLFAKKVSARKFATTSVDAFDERENLDLAQKYSVTTLDQRRPSMVPSITGTIADKTGRDLAYTSQRLSVEGGRGTGSRRPSIANDVTEYLHKNERQA